MQSFTQQNLLKTAQWVSFSRFQMEYDSGRIRTEKGLNSESIFLFACIFSFQSLLQIQWMQMKFITVGKKEAFLLQAF